MNFNRQMVHVPKTNAQRQAEFRKRNPGYRERYRTPNPSNVAESLKALMAKHAAPAAAPATTSPSDAMPSWRFESRVDAAPVLWHASA